MRALVSDHRSTVPFWHRAVDLSTVSGTLYAVTACEQYVPDNGSVRLLADGVYLPGDLAFLAAHGEGCESCAVTDEENAS